MLTPYVYAALAHERHQTFLAEAETDRRARQARLHRQQAGTSGARRSPLRRRPAWLHRVRVPSFARVLHPADCGHRRDLRRGSQRNPGHGAGGRAEDLGARSSALLTQPLAQASAQRPASALRPGVCNSSLPLHDFKLARTRQRVTGRVWPNR